MPGSTLFEPQPGWEVGQIGAERAEARHPAPLGAVPAGGAPGFGIVLEADEGRYRLDPQAPGLLQRAVVDGAQPGRNVGSSWV